MYRRLFMGLLILLMCAVGFGFYRGWFILGNATTEPGNNKLNYNLTVDPDKMKEDVTTLKTKTTNSSGKTTDGSK